jgi:hypothetical protein
MKILRSLALSALIGGATSYQASPASAQVSIQFHLGTPDRPLRGRQFETMRALAHTLGESAQEAVSVAGSNVRGRSRQTRQFLASLDDFARRADSFHERMDTYETRPWDVPREVVSLDQSARRVNDTIRRTRVFSNVADQWGHVVDVLDRMKRLLAGEEVRVPPAHGSGNDYDRDNGPFADNRDGRDDRNEGRDRHDQEGRDPRDQGGPVQPNLLPPASDAVILAGPRLEQYRQLTRSLDSHAGRALEIAGRMSRDDREYSQDLFLSLQHFNTDVRTLRTRADSGQLDRKDLNRLLAGAHEIDRKMRESRVFPRVWEEWKQSIDTLNQILDLVR